MKRTGLILLVLGTALFSLSADSPDAPLSL